jgi:ligand-binding sensor domain-containing protein/two-component sensor histidine kinase
MLRIVIGFILLFNVLTFKAQYPSYVIHNIENGAPSNEVYSIIQDKDGYIWVGCDAGIYRFNGVQYEYFTSKDLQARSATGLTQTPSGKIFGYNFKGQLFYMDKKGMHVIKNWKYNLNGISCDDSGNIWISSEQGTFIIDDKTLKISKHIGKYINYKKDSVAYTGSINVNLKGSIYFHNGVYLVERTRQGKETTTYIDDCFKNAPMLISKSKNKPWILSLTENKVFRNFQGKWVLFKNKGLSELLQGRKPNDVREIDNCLWISTYTGLIRFDLTNGSAQLLYPQIAFSGVLKDKEGNFWFSSLHHGILKIPNIKILVWNRNSSGKDFDQLSHIVSLKNKIVACGTGGQFIQLNKNNNTIEFFSQEIQSDVGSAYFDPIDDCIYFNKLSQIYRFKNGQTNLINSSSRAVKSMLHTHDGYFILSSQGIFFTKDIRKPLEKKDLLKMGWFREICALPDNKGYFVASNDGLLKLDKQNGHWKFTRTNISKQVITLSYDFNTNKVYVLTFDGKLYSVDISGKVSLFCSDLLFYRASNLSCHKGFIYVATIKGILRIALKNKAKELLTKLHGLPSNNIRSLIIESDTCWAASGDGIISVPLTSFRFPKIPGFIYGRGIELNKRRINMKVIPTIGFNDELTIYADGISYRSNQDFQLAYRIQGYSKNWMKEAGFMGKLEIPRLPAGEVTIEIKMIDYQGTDSANTLLYRFRVLPPFWQRWWFYVLLTLITLVLAAFIFRIRLTAVRKKQILELKRLKLENELRLTQQNALKAQMNPHFLFNVLNSIKGYIYENDKKNAARYLSDFSSLVRTILELSNKPTVSLERELEALKLYIDLEAMLMEHNFEFKLNVDANLDLSSIQIPALLLQPYVENAFKHGLRHKAGEKILEINIRMDHEEQLLIIEVTDNGIGRKAADELNAQNRAEHHPFATSAMEKRIELLNFERKDVVGVEIRDNFIEERSFGTSVIIRIHV